MKNKPMSLQKKNKDNTNFGKGSWGLKSCFIKIVKKILEMESPPSSGMKCGMENNTPSQSNSKYYLNSH